MRLSKIRQYGKVNGFWNILFYGDKNCWYEFDASIALTTFKRESYVKILGVQFFSGEHALNGRWFIKDKDIHGKDCETQPVLEPSKTYEINLNFKSAEEEDLKPLMQLTGRICITDQNDMEHWLDDFTFFCYGDPD